MVENTLEEKDTSKDIPFHFTDNDGLPIEGGITTKEACRLGIDLYGEKYE